MTRTLSHELCVHRVCCASWSCTPHDARCEIVNPHTRRLDATAAERASLGRTVVHEPDAA